MKKIIAFGIFLALCATCFAGCDMGNGLIAELFGNGVGDYVPGGDVILVNPIEPYPDVQTDETVIYDEPCIMPDIVIPGLVKMGYLTIYLMYADGRAEELMNTEELKDWNGTLTVPAVPGATIVIKGFAWYNDGCDVGYSCSNPNYKSDVVDINWNEYSHFYSPVDAEYLQGFYYELQLDGLNIGYNEVYLYGNPSQTTIDGWVMKERLDILVEALTEGDETVAPEVEVPVDPMPPEEMTGGYSSETAFADGN